MIENISAVDLNLTKLDLPSSKVMMIRSYTDQLGVFMHGKLYGSKSVASK